MFQHVPINLVKTENINSSVESVEGELEEITDRFQTANYEEFSKHIKTQKKDTVEFEK